MNWWIILSPAIWISSVQVLQLCAFCWLCACGIQTKPAQSEDFWRVTFGDASTKSYSSMLFLCFSFLCAPIVKWHFVLGLDLLPKTLTVSLGQPNRQWHGPGLRRIWENWAQRSRNKKVHLVKVKDTHFWIDLMTQYEIEEWQPLRPGNPGYFQRWSICFSFNMFFLHQALKGQITLLDY